jgi:hypothetical protein
MDGKISIDTGITSDPDIAFMQLCNSEIKLRAATPP